MIYLDHHATTPLAAPVRVALRAALDHLHANPSSIHRAGRLTRGRIESARTAVASACGATARELVFTSGGTEALHLAVHAIASGTPTVAFLVDPGAHPALRAAVERAAKSAAATVRTIAPDPWGRAAPGALDAMLSELPKPALVGLSWVQHETGAVAPLRALLDLARKHDARVVLDAVQALGKIQVDLGATGAVAAAISAHKIGGPSGVGAAWIRHDQRARSLFDGGAQERGLRAGTENTLGILGFGAAAEALSARLDAMPSVSARRDRFESLARAVEGVRSSIEGVSERVATVAHFWVHDIAGEELVAAMDLDGVCVSSGPACSSGRSGPSEALARMFPSQSQSQSGALRVSLGPETTDDEIEQAATVLAAVVPRIRGARGA